VEIRVTKPFDRERLLDDLRTIHRGSLQATRSFAVAAIVVGGGGAALLQGFSGPSGLVAVLTLIAGYGIYIAIGAEWSLRRAADNLPATWREDAEMVLTEETVIQQQPTIRIEIRWAAITKAEVTPASWLLFYGPQQALSIPRTKLTNEHETRLLAHLDTMNIRPVDDSALKPA
jgi:hypothetical protein